MKCVLYARVSTERQADKELSIPAQLEAMRAYAAARGWSVAREFVEAGASARTADRPALQEMLAAVRDQPPDFVLVHKVDRLARSVYDHATIRAMLKRHGVRLASVVENVDDSVSGQLVENIMASIAQFYSANLSEEIRKGMRQKVLSGGWPHRPPRGYAVAKSGEGPSTVTISPVEGPLVRRAFEAYATGAHSLKGMSQLLAGWGITGHGGRPVAAQYLRDLLSNPFYAGRLRWNGVDAPGNHEALVGPELFERVKRVLSERTRDAGSKGRVAGFPLRGIAVCARCRARMTACWQRSSRRRSRRWGYYRCSRRAYDKARCDAAEGCPATAAHDGVRRICESLALGSDTIAQVRRHAELIVNDLARESGSAVSALEQQRATLLRRELQLTESFLSRDVSPEAYRSAASAGRRRVETVDAEIKRLQRRPEALLSMIDDMLAGVANVAQLGDAIPCGRSSELLRTVFRSIVLDRSGVVGIALRSPFDSLFMRAVKRGDHTPPPPLEPAAWAAELVAQARDPQPEG
jgi:site-specific DNA recombinase